MFLFGTLLSILCILGALVYTEINPFELINFPIFLVLFFPIFFLGFLTQPKEFGNAFRSLLLEKDFDKKQREIHSKIFEVMGKVSYGVGWILFLILLFAIIKKNSDPVSIEFIVYACFRSIHPVIYGLFFYYIVFLPASIKVKNSIKY